MAGRGIPWMVLQLYLPAGSARHNSIPTPKANLAITVFSIGALA